MLFNALINWSEGVHKVEKIDDYDLYQKPAVKPLLVNASLNLRNIIGISERQQTISLEITLRMFWRDDRVNLTMDKDYPDLPRDPTHYNLRYMVETGDNINKFWMPDLFVDEAIKMRNPYYKLPTESLRVYEDSTIRFSNRLNFDVACHMDFKQYPVDQQYCIVKFESFSFTEEDILFHWLEDSLMISNPDIHLPHYTYNIYTDKEYKTDYYNQSYPGLELKIHLIRKLNYHIVQTFLPSILYVCIAYFSILIPNETMFVVVRTGMVMFTLLTLTSLTSRVRSEVPGVSDLTYMDLWQISCLIFIFSCMVIIVNSAVLNRRGRQALTRKIEFWMKVLYPTFFLVLCVFYWSLLLAIYFQSMSTVGT